MLGEHPNPYAAARDGLHEPMLNHIKIILKLSCKTQCRWLRRLDITDLLGEDPDPNVAARDVLHELMRALSGLRMLYDTARALVPSAAETLALAADRVAAAYVLVPSATKTLALDADRASAAQTLVPSAAESPTLTVDLPAIMPALAPSAADTLALVADRAAAGRTLATSAAETLALSADCAAASGAAHAPDGGVGESSGSCFVTYLRLVANGSSSPGTSTLIAGGQPACIGA